MAFCIIDDVYLVGVHAGTTYTANTTPNISQVNSWIDKIALDIESRLSAAGVIFPIDSVASPKAYALLKDLNAIGAAAEAEALIFNEQGRGLASSYTPESFRVRYENTLKIYEKFPIKLIDATLSSKHPLLYTAEQMVMFSGTARTYDYTTGDEKEEGSLEPLFRMDDEF